MRRLLSIVIAVALGGTAVSMTVPVGAATGQDAPATTSTIVVEPPADIIPRPGAGEAPEEAGDRGGALQLAILALVVLVIGGAVAHLVRQSRRAPGRAR